MVSGLFRQRTKHVSAFQGAAGNRRACIIYYRFTVNMPFDHKAHIAVVRLATTEIQSRYWGFGFF